MAIRVLFFAETPHRLAGAQRSLLAALTRIEAHGVSPLVVFPGPGVVEEAYRAAGVPTRLLQAPPSMLLFNRQLLTMGVAKKAQAFFRDQLPYMDRLRRLIVDEGFDAAHFNTTRGILIGGGAARLAGRPAMLHCRGAPLGYTRAYWVGAQALASRIVLVAHAIEPDVYRPFRGKTAVVHNGVAEQPERDRIAARRALADRLRRPELAASEDPVFVSLSSFTPFKGLHHLVRAADELRRRGVPARFVLAGGGGDTAYEHFIVRMRDELALQDRVMMLGFVPDPLTLLAAADAAVLPSVDREQLELNGALVDVTGTEGLPRSILEALSLGVPVVASRVHGVIEQVEDGITGRIVPPSDPVALADTLEMVAADTAWRESAGRAGREVARSRFSIDASSAGLARELKRMVEDHRS